MILHVSSKHSLSSACDPEPAHAQLVLHSCNSQGLFQDLGIEGQMLIVQSLGGQRPSCHQALKHLAKHRTFNNPGVGE